ncbi:MAG: sigma-54-dependent Fis family transcriptional regulator [Gammaproteobacteria bacterium]|nr:sigma-54-dependent Fis family transcriptional regulator [Gammaproteobacteria bacterium]
MKLPYILVVDDEPDIRALVQEILEDEGYQVATAENGEQARRLRRKRRPDLILLDIWMPDIDGISLLREWVGDAHYAPVVMISGHGTLEMAVEALRLGAHDFLEKPLSTAKLLLTVRRVLELEQLKRENRGLRSAGLLQQEPIGRSTQMIALRDQVQRMARHNAWVLLSGEPGSGLSLFARYLHRCSGRAAGPFVVLRVAALSDDPAAVELFGSERNGKIQYGLFEQANGGTLFLSEIADMAPAIQARLLSILENRSLVRAGGSEEVALDVRIVVATHKDLALEVQQGRFRGDLYYQLNVLPVVVPPLRKHPDDIPELIRHFIGFFAEHDGLRARDVDPMALERLRQYPWPGNVRELKNLVQRLLILVQGAGITLADVEVALGQSAARDDHVPAEYFLPLREARASFEKGYIEYHLQHSDGNIVQVARQAGIERTHLYRKLRALGIKALREDAERSGG